MPDDTKPADTRPIWEQPLELTPIDPVIDASIRKIHALLVEAAKRAAENPPARTWPSHKDDPMWWPAAKYEAWKAEQDAKEAAGAESNPSG